MSELPAPMQIISRDREETEIYIRSDASRGLTAPRQCRNVNTYVGIGAEAWGQRHATKDALTLGDPYRAQARLTSMCAM